MPPFHPPPPLQVAQYMRPKCHALLLDLNISSPPTVRLNIYQAFLLAAMKLHWYGRLALRDRGAANDTRAFLAAIQSSISYMVTMVRGRTRTAAARLGVFCRCNVSSCHVRWLGLKAFRRVLGRKQAGYARLLAQLDAQLALPQYSRLAGQLAAVVAPDRSAVFDTILY